MNKTINVLKIVGLILVLMLPVNLYAQKKKTTRIQAEYQKKFNEEEYLAIKIIVREKRYEALPNAEIEIHCITDTSKVILDKVVTDNEGLATYKIQDNPLIYIDREGFITFKVIYNGSESNKASSRQVQIKKGDLNITFSQQDSVKSIAAKVVVKDSAGISEPLEGVNVSFYIKGTFSLYNFGKAKTTDDGTVTIEFPTEMPGDTLGNLTIVAKIENDDILGTIESKSEINWGVPIEPVVEKRRGLGDTDAPLWMVYTLIILLSAVWFHYFYVIYLMFKIKFYKSTSPELFE